MTKEAYLEIVNSESDVINLAKEDIIEWLDTITANAKRLFESVYELDYGKLNEEEGEYENSIHPCGNEMYSLHIYEGIDLLAEAVGCTLECNDKHSTEYPFEYFFKRKGMRVFQLETEPLN